MSKKLQDYILSLEAEASKANVNFDFEIEPAGIDRVNEFFNDPKMQPFFLDTGQRSGADWFLTLRCLDMGFSDAELGYMLMNRLNSKARGEPNPQAYVEITISKAKAAWQQEKEEKKIPVEEIAEQFKVGMKNKKAPPLNPKEKLLSKLDIERITLERLTQRHNLAALIEQGKDVEALAENEVEIAALVEKELNDEQIAALVEKKQKAIDAGLAIAILKLGFTKDYVRAFLLLRPHSVVLEQKSPEAYVEGKIEWASQRTGFSHPSDRVLYKYKKVKDKWVKQGISTRKVAEWFLAEYEFTSMDDGHEIQDLMFYDPKLGRYLPAKALVTIMLHKLFRTEVSPQATGIILKKLMAANPIQRDKFGKSEGVVFKNGILDLATETLSPFNLYRLDISGWDTSYDPSAKWESFENDIVKQTIDSKQVLAFQEYCGYGLVKDCRYDASASMIGSGGNGKSLLIAILRNVAGAKNCSAVGMQELIDDPYAPANLEGKIWNFCEDLPSDHMRGTGIWKAIISGGAIAAQRKYGHMFVMCPTCKHFYLANQLPPTWDDSEGFHRRSLLFECPYKHDAKDAIRDELIAKMSTEESKSGIINWMLEGLARLVKNGGEFTRMGDYEERKLKHLRMSDPIKAFRNEETTTTDDEKDFIPKQEFWKAFIKWQKETAPYSQEYTYDGFCRRFKKLEGTDSIRKEIEGQRIWAWKGVRFKETVAPRVKVIRILSKIAKDEGRIFLTYIAAMLQKEGIVTPVEQFVKSLGLQPNEIVDLTPLIS